MQELAFHKANLQCEITTPDVQIWVNRLVQQQEGNPSRHFLKVTPTEPVAEHPDTTDTTLADSKEALERGDSSQVAVDEPLVAEGFLVLVLVTRDLCC